MKINVERVVADAVINATVFVIIASLGTLIGYEFFRNTPLYKQISKAL